MTREELIKQCKYYKGEEECPYDGQQTNKEMLWFYERCWFLGMLRGEDFKTICEEYKTYTANTIETNEKIPFTLRALLFNRYAQTSMTSREETIKNFTEFLNTYYGK